MVGGLSSRRVVAKQTASAAPTKPDTPLTAAEVAAWLLEFGTQVLDDSEKTRDLPVVKTEVEPRSLPLKPGEEAAEDAELANPFPADYLEGLPDEFD